MGEARRRKFAKCLFSTTGMCSMPSQFPWKHVYSTVCICAACEQVRQEEANQAREARNASARLFRDHPFKMDELNVLDTRESSPSEGQVVPVPGTKPVPNRRPALAFSLLAVALALNVPMGAELVEERDFGPRRRR